jgi:hypothetical protein
MSGMMLSALIGFAALILGLLIIHFTPDENRDSKRFPRN